VLPEQLLSWELPSPSSLGFFVTLLFIGSRPFFEVYSLNVVEHFSQELPEKR
jgi:hypothetical protein